MPKKSRRSRVKHKTRSNSRLLAAKEVSQRPQPLPPSPKQASVAKSPVTMTEQPVRYPYVLSEVRRALTIAGVLLLVLIALSFLLR